MSRLPLTSVNRCVGRFVRSAHRPFFGSCFAAALALTLAQGEALAQAPVGQIQAAIASEGGSDREVRTFYRSQGNRPIWTRSGTIGGEAETLLSLLESARLDGLDPDDYKPRAIASAMRKAEDGSPKALAKAELLLSRGLGAYVRDLRQLPRNAKMLYVDKELAPSAPSVSAALQAAATAPSLNQYLQNIGWMHPVYGQLRKGLANSDGLSENLKHVLMINLDRARALPAASRRHVLVDAAGARLYMYDNGRVVDSMRVVVGKPSEPTPMMAGLIRYASVNPYWNIPPDLVQKRVAAEVLNKGPSYLTTKRYELLSDWSEKPTILKPSSVDWKAVANGSRQLRVRQLPGANNAMGRMKFMFPNELGIYLHDTPEKGLLDEEVRNFSSGCVRLEDAARLGKWLFGKPLVIKSKKPDQRVDLPKPVPVFITYLTAAPEGTGIAYHNDVYNLDHAQLSSGRSKQAAR
ncbi:MAG: L,D-transpeptidase family protein [Sphingosinicella sp.]|nr:L,D-transpeptidase family protein [Sphingosinicella sp.]